MTQKQEEEQGVAASPPGHSDEPASGLAANAGSVPNAWQRNAANAAVELIREVGIYGLGGNDGCPCTSFEVRNVHVDVSCHKSEQTVRVWSHHMDFTDEKYRRCEAVFTPIADEVLRQVDAYYDAGGQYAADFTVRYSSWEEDNPGYAERQAQAMSAFGQDPEGLEAKPASAVAESDAPNLGDRHEG